MLVYYEKVWKSLNKKHNEKPLNWGFFIGCYKRPKALSIGP